MIIEVLFGLVFILSLIAGVFGILASFAGDDEWVLLPIGIWGIAALAITVLFSAEIIEDSLVHDGLKERYMTEDGDTETRWVPEIQMFINEAEKKSLESQIEEKKKELESLKLKLGEQK
jgi:hypothetical protein